MLLRSLLCAALLALGSCAKPAPVADADPALWVVRDADTTIYLFGSVHALKPGLSWFDEAVKQAFDSSDTLVLELVMPPDAEVQGIVQELGTAQDGVPLSERLPPDAARRLRAAAAEADVPTSALDGMEPWLAAIILGNQPAQTSGYDREQGVEAVLTHAAQQARKPIEGLETAREQFGYFDRLSQRAQLALLTSTIDGLPSAAATLDTMVTRWSAGDADGIARLLNDDLASSPELAQALLVSRNRHWADWVAARMARPGTVFVAVGAGHLAGGQSVLAELIRRGMTVKRIRY